MRCCKSQKPGQKQNIRFYLVNQSRQRLQRHAVQLVEQGKKLFRWRLPKVSLSGDGDQKHVYIAL